MNGIYFDSLVEYKLEKKEYCFLKENTNRQSDVFKIFLPKLMPLFQLKDPPKIVNNLFNNKIFVNDVGCRIDSVQTIKTQNYLTVKRKKNAWFKLHPQTFERYTRLICEIPEENIRNIQLTDDEFNTTNTEKKQRVYLLNPLYDFVSKLTVGDTVRFIVRDYYNKPIEDCNQTEEHYTNESHDPSQPRPTISHTHIPAFGCSGSLTVDWPDPICKIAIYRTLEGTITSVSEWGCNVTANGIDHPVPIPNIIGLYKNAGTYDSYYTDNEGS